MQNNGRHQNAWVVVFRRGERLASGNRNTATYANSPFCRIRKFPQVQIAIQNCIESLPLPSVEVMGKPSGDTRY